MNVIPASSQRGRELGVLGEEPVAGVDRLGAGLAPPISSSRSTLR